MLKIFGFCSSLLLFIGVSLGQGNDSIKKRTSYLEYINAKELEITKNKSERDQLKTSLRQLDTLYLAALQVNDSITHIEKLSRIQLNSINTYVAKNEEAITKNKSLSKEVKESQLNTKRDLDLKRLELSEINHSYLETEANVTVSEENVKELSSEINNLEEKLSDQELEFRKYKNEVDLKNSELTSLTISLDDASNKVADSKEEIKLAESHKIQLEGEIVLQKEDIKTIKDKIKANEAALRERNKSQEIWQKQAEEVKSLIVDLESFNRNKKEALAKQPDSLKTDKAQVAAQHEIRMAEGKLKSLYEELTGLEKDLSQLHEDGRVLSSENLNLSDEVQLLNAKLVNKETEHVEADRAYKKESDKLQVLNVNVHNLATQKEQKQTALQKAEGQLKFYKTEFESSSDRFRLKEEKLEQNRSQLTGFKMAKDSIGRVKVALEKEVNRLDGKDKMERNQIRLLRNEKTNLHESLDSLKKESFSADTKRAAINKNLVSSEEEVQGLKESKKLLKDRLVELNNSSEDNVLKGIKEAQKGDFQSFLVTLASVLEKEKSGEAATLQGYTHYVLGDSEKAEESYTAAIRSSPKYIDAYDLRSQLREEKENYNGALKDVNQMVYLDSTRGVAIYRRGLLLHYFLNDPEEACKSWQTALGLGIAEANEQIADHCLIENQERFYNVTQLTKRAVSDSYGYKASDPIKVGRNEDKVDLNIIHYLKLLRDSKNQAVKYARLGSCCRYKSENGLRGEALLERYRISFRNMEGKKDETILYFTYFDFENPLLPIGLNANFDIY